MEFYVTIYLYTQVYLVVIHHTNNFSSIKATVSIIYVAEVGSTILYFRAPNKMENTLQTGSKSWIATNLSTNEPDPFFSVYAQKFI